MLYEIPLELSYNTKMLRKDAHDVHWKNQEMELWVKSGMTPTEVLANATSHAVEVFGVDNLGKIKEGKKACSFVYQRQTGNKKENC